MIYAGEQGPWRSWIQVLSKNNKLSGEKYYKLGWKPRPFERYRSPSRGEQHGISPIRATRGSEWTFC